MMIERPQCISLACKEEKDQLRAVLAIAVQALETIYCPDDPTKDVAGKIAKEALAKIGKRS